MVTFAPDIVIAVVGVEPDCILNSPPLLFNAPNVVPSSFRVTSAPPASNTISAAASKVIEPVLSISAITGVVNVLFVNVSVVSLPTTVVVASWKVIVLSAVGSVIANVVSNELSVAPSNVIPPDVRVKAVPVIVLDDVIAPEPTVPANVTFAPLNVAAVVVPDLIIKLLELFVKAPYCEPPSNNKTSAPSASNLISPGASSVTSVVPFNTKSSTVVPASFIVILAPSASNTISAEASNVIVEPSISLMIGVVKVLFVNV